MDEQYQQVVINKAVAAIIANVGFSHSNAYSINVLANMAEQFMKRMAVTIKHYAEIGRTIPNLADVTRTFEDMDIKVKELYTYIQSVDSYTLPFKVPKLPVAETHQPEQPTPVVDDAEQSNTEARRQEIIIQFPNYVEIMAEEQRLVAERAVDESFNNTFDSLSSGVMSLRNPSQRHTKSKKGKKTKKKKQTQCKSTTKKGDDHDFAAPSSSLWLSRKRTSGGEIPTDDSGKSPPVAGSSRASYSPPIFYSSPAAGRGDNRDGEKYGEHAADDDDDVEAEEMEEPVYVYDVVHSEGLKLTFRRRRKT